MYCPTVIDSDIQRYTVIYRDIELYTATYSDILLYSNIQWYTAISQAARQGFAVLMASAIVVLKHETSTTYQSHIYESILIWNLDRVITSSVSATLPRLVKIVSAVAPPPGGEIYGLHAFVYYYFCFYILWHTYSLYPWTDFNAQ